LTPTGTCGKDGQSPEAAAKAAQAFIEDRIAAAQQAAEKGNRAEAIKNLAEAMHTIQDSYSPMHRDKDGNPREWNPWWPVGHSPNEKIGKETKKNLTPEIIDAQGRRIREAYCRVFPKKK
jgi:hypothetical protein